MTRVLVAAFGNELRGDDGFGIAVLRRLERLDPSEPALRHVTLIEVGTGGLWLAQQLLSPCDRLIIVDAVARGAEPGTVHVLKVDGVPPADHVDMHLAVPACAMSVAQAMGTLPRETYIVGCEPAETEELTVGLTPLVAAAVDRAAQQVRALVEHR